jgi:hypothetical protein
LKILRVTYGAVAKKYDASGFACTDRTEGIYDAETHVQISTAEVSDMFMVV